MGPSAQPTSENRMNDACKHKRVLLLANQDKPEAVEIQRELLSWLNDQVQVVGHNLGQPLDLARRPDADYLIVLGGDGTLLATVRELGTNQAPIIGVNIGKLGYLAEYSAQNLREHLPRALTDRSLISSRMILSCEISGPDGKVFESLLVNEVALIAGPPFRMIDVNVTVGSDAMVNCRGDGLIVSTPSGSTAYNLSAGGPILEPTLECVVITPLAPHSLSFRPVVVEIDQPICLKCPSCGRPGEIPHEQGGRAKPSAMIVIDGQVYHSIGPDDQIVIRRHPALFQLVRQPEHGPWKLLNTKLNWAAGLPYNKP